MEKVNKNDQSKTGIFGYLMGPSSSTSEVCSYNFTSNNHRKLVLL